MNFVDRHIGPSDAEIREMLQVVGVSSLDELVSRTVPENIRTRKPLGLPAPSTEFDQLARLRKIAIRNKVFKTYLGMGYSDCITPPVIQRNVLENPGWYTQYTPYQAEIAQGRLEALLNFQTMVSDLTGLEVSNASLLDEATAAAEAMALAFAAQGRDTSKAFFASELCHPQTLDVLKTRAEPLGIRVVVGDHRGQAGDTRFFGALLQYPATDGAIHDYRAWIAEAKRNQVIVAIAADILALTLLTPPGELGADIAVGSTQRFGVPLGFGGPHAAYFSTRDAFKRMIPGRIVGVSEDVEGRHAIRLALQTREQHIRRDKATSNICTAQVLLAVIAAMYAAYHGPEGLKEIARGVLRQTQALGAGLAKLGFSVGSVPVFDTLKVEGDPAAIAAVFSDAKARQVNLRSFDKKTLGISLDETTRDEDLVELLGIFAKAKGAQAPALDGLLRAADGRVPDIHMRKSGFLSHPVFNRHHSETEMLRYLHKLQGKDLSLTHSMIPLGSCTMKLNATAEMYPVTWPEFGKIHPFAPADQVEGYRQMIEELERMLAEITGFPAVSLQPNAGSQGEYAGLLVVRKYHESRGDRARDVCLIPRSAHGTNPASAVMAGMRVVVVECDDMGNVDLADLKAKAGDHSSRLAALMVTYPSTHGVFEESIREICEIVHRNGGQVYMDGANMNAQIGLCRPGEFGPDVCHLNLHKTFCIPHGGGGPGMGPIAVQSHLKDYLPKHPIVPTGGQNGIGAVAAAPFGSASILPISWMYISMMGGEGLKKATEVAILNANYLAKKLEGAYPVLYKGKHGLVAHECIFDLRAIKDRSGIDVEDVAKRLMDYGYHAPTISFPVPGTMMVEPTESESTHELDRFIEAMLAIREEIAEVESGKADRQNNLLKNAPHTATQVASDSWDRPYSRSRAVFPVRSVRDSKFWPSVARINNVLGDRNLICSCPEIDEYV